MVHGSIGRGGGGPEDSFFLVLDAEAIAAKKLASRRIRLVGGLGVLFSSDMVYCIV